MRKLTGELYPGERIVLTDEMRKTAPFSRRYLPKFVKAPKYIFTEDRDTGIGCSGKDQLSLVVGGITVLTIAPGK